jgi:hypothetical protein
VRRLVTVTGSRDVVADGLQDTDERLAHSRLVVDTTNARNR